MIIPDFCSEPPLDFGRASNRKDFEAALRRVEGRLGSHYPVLIAGEPVDTLDRIVSYNPAHPGQVIGTHSVADLVHVDRAVQAGWETFPFWSRTSVEERALVLLRAAEAVRKRRHELGALMVYEVGKPW